jgi:hypothetical protein
MKNMSYIIGDRIGAIQQADDETVWLFGYGVYKGEHIPPDGFLHYLERENPKIQLDNGKVVWGYQCWWGDEEKVKEAIGNRKVVMVDPPSENNVRTEP